MPATAADAKGFQDSAVQSAEGSAAGAPEPAAGKAEAAGAESATEVLPDEPDRQAAVLPLNPFEGFARAAPVEKEMRRPAWEEGCADPFSSGGDAAPIVTLPESPYPQFAETNPFRAGAGVRRRERAGESLCRRRGSTSELRIVIPESPSSPTGGGGAAAVAQRAVGQDRTSPSGGRGDLGRRDSIWDRLPPPDAVSPRRGSSDQQSGAASRFLRSPFSVAGGTPTPDQTNEEGRTLFLEFVRDRIEKDIQDEDLAVEARNDDYFNRIMSLPGLSNPVWAQTGTELRALADAFATSHQRQELRCKAHQTNLTDLTWERFRQLLEELFSGEVGITQERILVLFFFLSDCVVATIRRHAWQHLRRLIEWSLRYIVERVCALVQQAGGWGVVLRQSVEYVYLALKMAALGLVCTAACIYIRKSWH